jgi:hypothetical protein
VTFSKYRHGLSCTAHLSVFLGAISTRLAHVSWPISTLNADQVLAHEEIAKKLAVGLRIERWPPASESRDLPPSYLSGCVQA